MDFLSPDRMNRTELIRIIVCQFALVSAVALFVAEFLKILVTCALFVLAAKLCAGLNWPAMLSGIIAAAGSMFLLPLFKR